MLELNNLEEASKPSVERKYDDFGEQSTGIPVKHCIRFAFKNHSLL